MYDDLGARTKEAKEISLKSRSIVSSIVIGNAPSAALTVCELVERGLRPALVVATPVGFVNAAKSKEIVRTFDTPSISCMGTRGGNTCGGCGCE